MGFHKLLILIRRFEFLHVLICCTLECVLDIHAYMLKSVRVGERSVILVQPDHEQ